MFSPHSSDRGAAADHLRFIFEFGELNNVEEHSDFFKIKQKSKSPFSFQLRWSALRTAPCWGWDGVGPTSAMLSPHSSGRGAAADRLQFIFAFGEILKGCDHPYTVWALLLSRI